MVSSPFVRAKRPAWRVQCELSSRYLPPLFATRRSRYRFSYFLFSSVLYLALSPVRVQYTKKGSQLKGRKFITREQQVITLKADFSEAIIRGRKESTRDRGSRVNDGNPRPAMASASESKIARRNERDGKGLGREKRIRGKAQRGDDTAEKNGGKDRPKNKRVAYERVTYVRPEHDAVIIVNRRGGERMK